jgi:hypothetical protein
VNSIVSFVPASFGVRLMRMHLRTYSRLFIAEALS